MSSSGTLLSDLVQKGTPPGDDDLVKQIYRDMNGGGIAASMNGGNEIINSPNPNTVAPLSMDSAPATSHIIGRDHPTPADFAAAMAGVQRPQQPEQGPPPMPGNLPQYNMASPWLQQQQQVPMMAPSLPTKNIYSRVAEEIKTPIFVMLLVFVFSLPAINVLFSHYIPSLVKPTGDLTTIGSLVKSVAAGVSFWILQRVITPLLSL